MSDTVCPIQKSLKFGWTCSVLNGLIDRRWGRAGVMETIAEDYTHPVPRLYV